MSSDPQATSDSLADVTSKAVATPAAGRVVSDEPALAPRSLEGPAARMQLQRTAPLYVRRSVWGAVRSSSRLRVDGEQSSGSQAVSGQERPAATWAMRVIIACAIVALIVAFMLFLLALR